MPDNSQIVQQYMEAYSRLDHAAVLALLTDDVEWYCPGMFDLRGKAAFAAEMDNPAFQGAPEITTTRLIEAEDVVIAEGRVRGRKVGGETFTLEFCDVFELRGGLISRLASYFMPVGQ